MGEKQGRDGTKRADVTNLVYGFLITLEKDNREHRKASGGIVGRIRQNVQ